MVTYADNFDRADTSSGSGLGSTSTGTRAWTVVQGSWRISGNRAVPSAASPVPIAVLDLPGADADASCIGSGGAALYSRVVDASNWVRARTEYSSQTTTTPYSYTTYSTVYDWVADIYVNGSYDRQSYVNNYGPSAPSDSEFAYVGSGSNASVRNKRVYQTRQVESGTATGYSTSTSYSYLAVLEVCLAGTVTEVARTSAGSTLSRLRLKLAGSSAQIFYGGATTVAQLPAGASTLAASVRHGIGLGPSSIQDGYVDDYSVEVLNTAPGAPTSTAPAANAVVAGSQPIRHAWTVTDPDVGDKQTAFELNYRVAGTTTWTVVNQTTETQYWDAPTGLLSGDIEWRVRVTDTAGGVSPWSEVARYSMGTSGGGTGGGIGGGGGLGLTPAVLILMTQLAELKKRVDQLTGTP